MLQAPRSVYAGEKELDVTGALFQTIEIGRKFRVPFQLGKFAGYALRGQEAYLSFHEDQRYFFHDASNGNLVEVNIKQYLSPDGPLDQHKLKELAKKNPKITQQVKEFMMTPAELKDDQGKTNLKLQGKRRHRAALVREMLRLLGRRWDRYWRWVMMFGVHFYILTIVFANAWAEILRTIWTVWARIW
ncbi:hypothetical protein ABW21_db0201495 [Orbilia brochopaga]|nr:hypothetical protein ABW21_db0201495 [Drechslerella brochopaga]